MKWYAVAAAARYLSVCAHAARHRRERALNTRAQARRFLLRPRNRIRELTPERDIADNAGGYGWRSAVYSLNENKSSSIPAARFPPATRSVREISPNAVKSRYYLSHVTAARYSFFSPLSSARPRANFRSRARARLKTPRDFP